MTHTLTSPSSNILIKNRILYFVFNPENNEEDALYFRWAYGGGDTGD